MAAKFCAAMLMGFGVLCFGDSDKRPVVDATCDMATIKLPADWREQCVGPDKRIRADLPATKKIACQRILANNRTIKKRCP